MALYAIVFLGLARYARLHFTRRVAAEGPRRRELAQLVSDHVLGHVQLDELAAVMDFEFQPDELRHDGAGAAPCADRTTSAAGARLLRFAEQHLIHVRALLSASRHLQPQSFSSFS